MKVKKILGSQNKLLKFKIIQSKIYNKYYCLNNIKIEDIEYRLKKAFYIIFKYHVLKKRILFIGTPTNMDNTIKNNFKKTNHFLIPESVWVNGLINNKTSFFQQFIKNKKISNKKISEILFYFQKDIDLIVLLNEPDNLNVLNESYLAKIPIISLNSTLDIHNIKSNYKIPGDFRFSTKKIRDNFFYSMLISVLKMRNRSTQKVNNSLLSLNQIKNK